MILNFKNFKFFLAFGIFFLAINYQCLAKVQIIDAHEHIQDVGKSDELVKVMEKLGIQKTILLPSPAETLEASVKHTFTKYQDNINEILKISKKYPGRFIPFCTISPLDKNALDILKDCHERGGMGLKLYNGHSYYYKTFGMPLDSPVMDPIYSYAEKEKMPVVYHAEIESYGSQMENVLRKYPDMVVSIPHYMVTGLDFAKLEHFLDTYPNTYTDISFGNTPFMTIGFMMISGNIEKFLDFFNKYQDRILFGADMVLTEDKTRGPDYMEEVLNCYIDILEKDSFTCKTVNDYVKKDYENSIKAYQSCKPKSGSFCKKRKQQSDSLKKQFIDSKNLKGLALSPDILNKIFISNPEKFLSIDT